MTSTATERGFHLAASKVNFKHLSRPPIAEATLDVQVDRRSDLKLSDFDDLKAELRAEFPRVDERRRFQTRFGISPDVAGQTVPEDLGADGYVFRSVDGKDVAQFRLDGFTLNRLAPYPGWSTRFPQFTRLWRMYAHRTRPARVVRIGTRCINVVPIRADAQIDDYLNAPPPVPRGLAATPKTFVSRLELVADAAADRRVDVVQMLQPAASGGDLQLLFDIDAYVVGDFLATEVPDLFEPLHELRNQTFFSTLTKKVINSFL